MSKESADLANVRLALSSIEYSCRYKMDHAYTVSEYAENALMRDNAKSAINYINDMKKELDELREKAEAFDFLSGHRWFESGDFGVVGYSLFTHDSEWKDTHYEGKTLLDCVKQARECEG